MRERCQLCRRWLSEGEGMRFTFELDPPAKVRRHCVCAECEDYVVSMAGSILEVWATGTLGSGGGSAPGKLPAG